MSWWTELFPCCDSGEHPGGTVLIDRAITLCDLSSGSRIADIAAGSGETVRYLESRGYAAFGADHDAARVNENVCLADAAALPFASADMDCVLIECAFSQMTQPCAVLAECSRICRRGGWLILTDLYARDDRRSPDSPLGRLDTKKEIIAMLAANGFTAAYWSEESKLLTELWMQALMNGSGAEMLEQIKKTDGFRLSSCGYYMCIAKKE